MIFVISVPNVPIAEMPIDYKEGKNYPQPASKDVGVDFDGLVESTQRVPMNTFPHNPVVFQALRLKSTIGFNVGFCTTLSPLN